MKRTAYVGIIAFLTMGALAGHGHFTRAQAQEEQGRERLDRGLRNIQDGGSPRPHHDAPLAAQAPEQVSVILIGTPDEAALADLGFRVITRTRDGVTARGPLATAPDSVRSPASGGPPWPAGSRPFWTSPWSAFERTDCVSGWGTPGKD